MKFIVTRVDALHDETGTVTENYRRQINKSEHWPCIVEADSHANAVEVFYSSRFPGSRVPMDRPFLVAALLDAAIVEFNPVRDYIASTVPVMISV